MLRFMPRKKSRMADPRPQCGYLFWPVRSRPRHSFSIGLCLLKSQANILFVRASSIAVWSRLKTGTPSELSAQSSPSIYADFIFRELSASIVRR